MTNHAGIVILALGLHIASCGTRVNTGRNNNPAEWPKSDESVPPEDANSDPNDSSGRGLGGRLVNASCFKTPSEALPGRLAEICDSELKTNPHTVKLHEYLCERKYLINALSTPSCGWQGDNANIMNYAAVYERESQSTGKDYQDVHSTMTHLPVSADKFIHFVRLAFEDYSAFKQAKYQWISGTRENTNLNRGKLETGVDFKFRVDRESYELGYTGHIKLYQIDDRTWIHVNYADSDFVRVQHFAQLVLYAQQNDGSTMVVKLEHKQVESDGLYNRAWMGSVELMKDFMNKSWTNMVRREN